MAKPPVSKARLARAYVVKAAESRPSLVTGRSGGKSSVPSVKDKSLVRALRDHRRG